VLAIYLVGLTVAIIFNFYVVVLRVIQIKKRRHKRREEKRAMGKIRKNTEIEEIEENQASTQREQVVADKMENRVNVEQVPAQQYNQYVSPAKPTMENDGLPMTGYIPPQTNQEPPQYVSPQDRERQLMTSSKPIIFRTRMDPNLLIYEYSDRLVFYKKTLNGLEHVKTERKPIR
jgi:hypothetical protein